MALAQTVQMHNAIGNATVTGDRVLTTMVNQQPYNTSVSCHFATIYWLLTELHGVPPTLQVMMDQIVNVPGAITQMVQQSGTRLKKPLIGQLTLTPSSVIVFYRNGQAEHSCVALNQTQVGGYNQVDWFVNAQSHRYSVGAVTALVWGTGANKNTVRRYQGQHDYELWSISQNDAIAALNTIRNQHGY
jgi:hypothetical protein